MFQFMQGGRIAGISAEETLTAMNDGTAVLIDVREAGELAMSGKAAGAKHIPVMALLSRADTGHPDHDTDLTPDKTIVLYCASGARSNAAGQMLQRLGFDKVRNLGGLNDWLRGGGEIEKA